MKNILVLGATPKNQEDVNFYNSIAEICKNFALDVKSPIDTMNCTWDDRERYNRAFEKVKNADLVIGDQSKPSTGQGMEIKDCDNLQKPFIAIAKNGSEISGLVKGCPATKEIIYYEDIEDVRSKLMDVLKNY